MAYKPDSVRFRATTIHLGATLPIRSCSQPGVLGQRPPNALPIWPCFRRGLPSRPCCQRRGGLLPHRFTLTLKDQSGFFSVALSLGLLRPGVTRRRANVKSGLSSLKSKMLYKGGRPAIRIWAFKRKQEYVPASNLYHQADQDGLVSNANEMHSKGLCWKTWDRNQFSQGQR